jgi:tetratricopeptide (TPR) repeat protein
VASKNNLKRLSTRDWPFDKLLLLAYWQESFAQKPTTALAKRSAFLFDGTSFGINSVLYLADSAVRSKNLQMGAFYLNRINADSLSAPQKMSWLDTKLRLELDAGKTDTALKTFKEMSSLDERIPVMTRLRLALLYQQRRDFDTAREQLLIMWKDRNKLPTALQAETLFWLGEGEQAVRNTDKALDYYLRLAWQYPQENIWALTAMYRASLIYERQGKYETAKRLLTTVVRRADRKEQREAAKARINAIDKKMGETDKNEESALVYPF